METSSNTEKTVSPFRQILILVILAGALFIIEREFSNFLGKRAVSKSGMESLEISKAFELGQQDNKRLLVNFSAYWCGYCRSFESGTLSDNAVQEFIQNRFHYVRLEHTDKKLREWFDKYQIYGFPTVLIISPEGTIVSQVSADEDPTRFLAQFEKKS